MVTIPSRPDHLIPENTNDGFATQSFSHRFAVRVFHDLASLEQDKNPQPQAQQTTQTTTTAAGSAADQGVPASGQGKLISVKTDVLDLTINTRGGDVEQALLPAYPKELNSTQPFQLLETSPQFIYQAQSGLTGRDGPDNPANGPRPLYNVEKDAYVLAEGQTNCRCR